VRRSTAALALTCLALTACGANATGARVTAAVACPSPPRSADMTDPAFYSYVNTYNGDCASAKNHGRSFADVEVSTLVDGTNRFSVTASAALGGAIASLRVNDKEFIASGGHGAALQWAFHAWDDGKAASECYNPTQAGSRPDDAGPPPYHGPSTSLISRLARTGTATVSTRSQPAMYVPLSMTTPGYGGCHSADLQPRTAPYNDGLSPYSLNTSVSLAPGNGLANLPNVARVNARLTASGRKYPNLDAVFVGYLQRDFTDTYSYAGGTLTTRKADAPGTLAPVLKCTHDHAYCLGMYFPASSMPGAYYYTQDDRPNAYNGLAGAYTEQVTVPAHDVGTYRIYLAVGNLARVESTLDALAAQAP
jgi:hypothetical protein